MASDLDFVEYVADQLSGAGGVTYRKMFGDVVEAPAYPGAKPSFLILEQLEDSDWMTRLVRLTDAALPPPKPKKKKKAR